MELEEKDAALLLEDLLEVGRLLFAPDQVECEAERLEHVDLPRSSSSLTASEVAATSRQAPKGTPIREISEEGDGVEAAGWNDSRDSTSRPAPMLNESRRYHAGTSNMRHTRVTFAM